jgi:hypothetical protein
MPDYKRQIQRSVSEVGYGRELLRMFGTLGVSGSGGEVNQSLVDPSIREWNSSIKRGRVLLPMLQGHQRPNCYKYCILAHAFRTRGYAPIIPICYKHLPLCREKTPELDDQVVCDACNVQSNELLDLFGLSGTNLDDILGDDYRQPELSGAPGEVVTYRGVRVSDYALASTRKFLKKYHLDCEADEDYYRRFLRAAAVLVDATNELFESMDIDAVIAHDVNYVYGGVFLAVAQNRGIPAYSNAYAYNEGKVMFGRQSNEMATAEFTDRAFVDRYLEQPLDPTQREQLETLMDKRMAGRNRNFEYSPNSGQSVDIGTDSTSAMFTNLIWDDSLAFDSDELPGYFEWVDTTIEHFANQPEQGLIIKTHPAEEVHGTNERIGDYVRAEHSPLPDNILLLDPDTDRDTYAIASEVDTGIVYNSTVGLEMAYLETPVVVAGVTHYRDHGFTFDANSESEYLDLLSSHESLSMTDEMTQRAERYAHLIFIKKQIDFPYVTFTGSGESGYGHELHPVTHAELEPRTEPFDTVVDSVINDEPVVTN